MRKTNIFLKLLFVAIFAFLTSINTFGASIIRNAIRATSNQWICFRGTFEIDSENPADNELHIAADSKYWLWVNGELEVFEGQLKRGPNPNDTYIDVLSLNNLQQGCNTIAVLVWYFGKEGFAYKKSDCPGLYFDLKVGNEHFGSDETWLTAINPAYYTPPGEVPNWRLAESNVGFNARKEFPEWTTVSYDASSWASAQKVEMSESGW